MPYIKGYSLDFKNAQRRYNICYVLFCSIFWYAFNWDVKDSSGTREVGFQEGSFIALPIVYVHPCRVTIANKIKLLNKINTKLMKQNSQ